MLRERRRAGAEERDGKQQFHHRNTPHGESTREQGEAMPAILVSGVRGG